MIINRNTHFAFVACSNLLLAYNCDFKLRVCDFMFLFFLHLFCFVSSLFVATDIIYCHIINWSALTSKKCVKFNSAYNGSCVRCACAFIMCGIYMFIQMANPQFENYKKKQSIQINKENINLS